MSVRNVRIVRRPGHTVFRSGRTALRSGDGACGTCVRNSDRIVFRSDRNAFGSGRNALLTDLGKLPDCQIATVLGTVLDHMFRLFVRDNLGLKSRLVVITIRVADRLSYFRPDGG